MLRLHLLLLLLQLLGLHLRSQLLLLLVNQLIRQSLLLGCRCLLRCTARVRLRRSISRSFCCEQAPSIHAAK